MNQINKNLKSVFSKIQLSKLINIFVRNKVDFAYLVGSYARGRSLWNSDIDIFVSLPWLVKEKDFNSILWLSKINSEIDIELGIEKVEVQIFELLPLHIQFNGISEGILLYQKEEQRRINYIEFMLPKYYDHMFWFKRYLQESLKFQDEVINAN